MKKTILFTLLAIVLMGCASNDFEENSVYEIPTHLNGVEINGVRWATRNLDLSTPSGFADNPECFGMYFRFVKGYDNCPDGWRMPTREELEALIGFGGVFTYRNGVKGRLFGVMPNQIFLPLAGFFYNIQGNESVQSAGISSGYMSGTYTRSASGGWYIAYRKVTGRVHPDGYISRILLGGSGSISIRCVAID